MIIVDTALEKRAAAGKPVRIGLVGAGFMARGVALQIALSVPGMRVAAIANRTLEGARRAYREAGQEEMRVVDSVGALERAIEAGVPAVTEDALLLCQAGGIDAIVDEEPVHLCR